MATIVNRGPYQFLARIRKKGFKPLSKTFINRKDAEAWARMIESEMERGLYITRSDAESTTFSEALERYKQGYIPQLSDAKRELNRATALQKRSLKDRFLSAIRAKDIANFIKERESEGAGPNTIRLDLALISKMFRVAASDWGMESLVNPVKKASKPKLPNGRERRFEDGEEEKLLKACTEKFRIVVRFAIETAMRRGEIVSLRWQHINLKQKSAYLPKTKNGEARTVPLSPNALEILESIPKNMDGSVFGYNHPDALTKNMQKARAKAKIDDFRFHDLRHEATSRLFENTDLDIMEIKTITGHKSLQMLARYSHLRTHRLADRLAGMKRGMVASNV